MIIHRMYQKVRAWLGKLYNLLRFSSYRSKPAKEVFEDIYYNKKWSGKSHSGPGSDLDQTSLVRQGLQQVIINYNIESLLDVPCGDWFWMQHLDLSAVKYTGGDIVEKIVQNNQKYARDKVSFLFLDLLESQLPAHDLVLCRDCLVHFSYQDIKKTLDNLIDSGCNYLLTTTFPGRQNYNITTGNWRPIDLQGPPFELPGPLMIFNEGCMEGNGSYNDKSLALWDLGELKKLHSKKHE